jgi:hypothetical protein
MGDEMKIMHDPFFKKRMEYGEWIVTKSYLKKNKVCEQSLKITWNLIFKKGYKKNKNTNNSTKQQ